MICTHGYPASLCRWRSESRATIHQEELEALWKAIQETGEYFTIKGLE